MNGRKFLIFMSLVLAAVALTWGIDQGWAQSPNGTGNGKITPAERKAAATRAQSLGLKPGVAGLAAAAAIPAPTDPGGPGGVPHYFGPYGNWAYSPLPRGPVAVVTLVDGGTGYTAPVVTIDDVYGTGAGAGGITATVGVGGAVVLDLTGFTGGDNYSAPIVTITDPTGTGAAATATIGGTLTGGIHKFVDRVAGVTPAGANLLGQYIPIAVRADWVDNVGVSHPDQDYYEIAVVEYNEKMHTDLPPTRQRAYVQLATTAVPGDNVALFQPDGTTPISMPDGTQARAVDYPHFLGPTIIAASNRPVRIKFHNLLPTGAGGNLFLPVDETVMGSGPGPKYDNGAVCDPMMDTCAKYTQNRAVVHLHGNNTVWISDGTPHQWITPANESTPYPQGVSVRSVPDMNPAAIDNTQDGMTTLYYTNAQSARLMFYHDHALAITRLNVYAGMAAGYVVTDPVEKDMIEGTNVTGVNPTGLIRVLPDIGIPLVIQDRTFVDNDTIWAQDPTWNWGTGPRDSVTGRITTAVTGDLWVPHVYMSAQNPWDLSGTNAFGRWHYGPWFINQTPTCDASGLPAGCIAVGPVPNPYYQSVCDLVPPGPGCTAPWEPPLMPGTPNPSMPGEAFNDTPTVNGTVYPYMEVEPKAYRFRILNAANDRFFNLQLYVAADKTTPTTPGTVGTVLCDGLSGAPVDNCTEVKMVPVSVAPANQLADWPSGIPDPTTAGPNWIQIGTEGGFLSKPAVIPQQPIGWNLNPTTFNYGNVNQHSLLLGTAERADVVVDFSAFAGKTLILYNDSPAAFPAGVPNYDYYTGTPDQMDTGGAPTTQPGYGPNTRTIMQIRVGTAVTTPTDNVTLANLNAVFAKSGTKRGVFEASQDPIIVPQAAYNSAYNNTFSATARGQYLQLADGQMTFQPIDAAGTLQPAVTMPLEMKAMHDEMGGVYDTQFGRMSGMLGLTNPISAAHVLIPYGYASPPTDVISGSISGTQIGSFPDGTQIWRIFHNGVDTHTIHVHLFNAQLINRVGQDGIMLPPDPNELGWKDTFRVNPLEVTFIAMRPIIPTPAQVPFKVPNSIRLIDPTLPDGAPLPPPPPAGWFGPDGNNIDVFNHTVNFGWEYVWHCHILAHEEMDMMHSLAYAVPPNAPTGLSASIAGSGNNKRAVLNWTDASLNETGFTVQKATTSGFSPLLATFTVGPNVTTYSDTIGNTTQAFYYRVQALNTVGDTAVYTGSTGFPTKTAVSGFSNTAGVNLPPPPPAAPGNVQVTCARNTTGSAANRLLDRCTVTWADNSSNETGFRIQSATNSGFTLNLVTSTVGTNVITFTTGNLTRGVAYYFHVQSYNTGGTSAYVNALTFPINTP